METTEIKKRGRFVLEQRTGELVSPISEHRTFAEAEAYREEIGVKGKHVDYIIVDRSKNLVAEVADENELEELDRQIAVEKKRADLRAMREENRLAEMTAKGETKVG